jgi:hypothetical protein
MRRLAAACSLLLLLSIAACGPTAYGSGARGTRPPPLPSGSTLPKWEHYCVAPGSHLDKVLTAAGGLGWELVAVTNTGLFCFKRPHVEVAAAPPAGD